jgi:hypothetical protein
MGAQRRKAFRLVKAAARTHADVSALRMRIYIAPPDILNRGFGGERHIFLAASLTLTRH